VLACPERLRLTVVYSEAVRAFSKVTTKYSQSRTGEELDRLSQNGREAKQVVEAALSELDKHIAEHGC